MRNRLLGLALAVLLVGCSSPAPQGRSVIVADTLEGFMSEAAREALKLGRKGALGHGLTVDLASTDRYGKTSTLPGATFVWDPVDLQRVDWDGITDFGVLDLAKLDGDRVTGREGLRAMLQWCATDDGETLTPNLCERARAAFSSGAVG